MESAMVLFPRRVGAWLDPEMWLHSKNGMDGLYSMLVAMLSDSQKVENPKAHQQIYE